jgi:hypothetical protein
MVIQEQLYQVGVLNVKGPAQGEHFISIGPHSNAKTYEINPRLLVMLKDMMF